HPADRDLVARVVLDQDLLDVGGRGDRLAAHRGDRVALGQAGAGRRGAGQGAGDGHAAAGAAAVGAAAVALAAGAAAVAEAAEAAAEAAAVAEAARVTGATARATARAAAVALDAEESGGADVDGGRALAGLDLLGDGLRVVDRDGVGLDGGGLAGLGLELGAAGGRGVHADHLAVGVDQRAAGVARLDVRVGLDQPGQLLAVGAGPIIRRGDALVQGGDRAGGDRRGAALAARVAQRGHGVASLHAGGVAQVGGGEAGRVLQLDHRDVLGRVVPDHLGRVAASVAHVGDLDRGGPPDHVVVGEHGAVGGQHDAGARRDRALIALGGHDVDQRG